MELTQIKGTAAGGDSVGDKVQVKVGDTCPLPRPKDADKGDDSSLGKIEHKEDKKIITPHKDIHTELNSKKITKPTEIKHGDTVSVGEKKDVVLAVHEPGKKLDKADVKSHSEQAGHTLTDEEYRDIVKQVNTNKNFVVGTAIGTLFLIVFIGWFVGMHFKSEVIKIVSSKFGPTQAEINQLNNIIGQQPECDEDDIGCLNDAESQGSLIDRVGNLEGENKALKDQIVALSKVNEKILGVEEKLGEVETSINDILSNDNKEVTEELKGQIEELGKTVETLGDNSEITGELDKLSLEIEKINPIVTKIDALEELVNEGSASGGLGAMEGEVGDAVRKLLNKVLEIKAEVGELKKDVNTQSSDTKEKIGELVEDIKKDIKAESSMTNDQFQEKFASCEAAGMMASVEVLDMQLEYYYEIVGEFDGMCEVLTKFTKNPNPDFIDQEMTCLLDNTKPFNDAIQEVYNSFKTDTELGDCAGDGYDLMKNFWKFNSF